MISYYAPSDYIYKQHRRGGGKGGDKLDRETIMPGKAILSDRCFFFQSGTEIDVVRPLVPK